MTFVQSPYRGSRSGKKVDLVVIHTMVGTYKGTISYFQNNTSQVSAHYCVDTNGETTQMVVENEYANHAGIVDHPSAKLVVERPGVNPNLYSIGIENADNSNPAGADRTSQYPALIKLVFEICKRNAIPVDRDHIVGHHEIRFAKSCPGNLDVDYIVREVQKLDTPEKPVNTGAVSELQIYLGVTDDAGAKLRLKEHLGERDGKCNWGAEPAKGTNNEGGYLGSTRAELKVQKEEYSTLLASFDTKVSQISENAEIKLQALRHELEDQVKKNVLLQKKLDQLAAQDSDVQPQEQEAGNALIRFIKVLKDLWK